MPEGDTLFRIATNLRPVLVGRVVRRLRSPLPELGNVGLEGRSITAVEARGKNLLITFDDGRTLHTHLRMSGSWHLYRPGEPWQKSERWMRVALDVEGAVAVCFGAPVVRLLSAQALLRDPALKGLGPDFLADSFDVATARARLRRTALPLGEALLTQSAVSGAGNVYKSEVLFLERLDPFAPVTAYSDDELDRVLARTRELMKVNVAPGHAAVPFRSPRDPFLMRGRITTRTTRSGCEVGKGPVHVYGRAGEPCFTCGTTIRMRRQGATARSTYYCPTCQPARALPSARPPGDAGAP